MHRQIARARRACWLTARTQSPRVWSTILSPFHSFSSLVFPCENHSLLLLLLLPPFYSAPPAQAGAVGPWAAASHLLPPYPFRRLRTDSQIHHPYPACTTMLMPSTPRKLPPYPTKSPYPCPRCLPTTNFAARNNRGSARPLSLGAAWPGGD